jgi:hypothetical protein
VFFNSGTQIAQTGVGALYCDVQGGYGAPGDSNLNKNPIFSNRVSLKIVNGSPCIDRGFFNQPMFNDVCFTPCADPNDPVCMLPSLGTSRNDIGAGGGPGTCPGHYQGVLAVDDAEAPSGIALAISPNPTRGDARVTFVIPQEGDVKVEVCDVQGRAVARLVDQRLAPGTHTVKWDGRGRDGFMNSGVYLVRLRTQERTEVRRLALIR